MCQAKSDALGEAAGATNDDDDDGDDGAAGGGGGVSESKGGEDGDAADEPAAGAAEEDLAEKEAEDEADEGTIAFECLDTARFLYEKRNAGSEVRRLREGPYIFPSLHTPPSGRRRRLQERDLLLHKVRMRLGDAFIEAEDFPGAMAEYKAAVEALNGHVKPSDRRIVAAFLAMGMVRGEGRRVRWAG